MNKTNSEKTKAVLALARSSSSAAGAELSDRELGLVVAAGRGLAKAGPMGSAREQRAGGAFLRLVDSASRSRRR
jgi:hypothetical protein